MSTQAATTNHQIRLARRPVGLPTRTDWTFSAEPVAQPDAGGEILDAVLTRLNRKARIVICGAISQYNNTDAVKGPANYLSLLVHRARMEGMVVFDYVERFPAAITELASYLKDGRMTSREDIVVGFDTFPETLLKLFRGENFGKLILQVAER